MRRVTGKGRTWGCGLMGATPPGAASRPAKGRILFGLVESHRCRASRGNTRGVSGDLSASVLGRLQCAVGTTNCAPWTRCHGVLVRWCSNRCAFEGERGRKWWHSGTNARTRAVFLSGIAFFFSLGSSRHKQCPWTSFVLPFPLLVSLSPSVNPTDTLLLSACGAAPPTSTPWASCPRKL